MRSWLFYLVAATWLVLVRGDFKLVVLHTNDMHARFEQISRIASKCSDSDVKKDNCFGGFARVAQVVKDVRERAQLGQGPPVLFLNAGDTFQGTIWYNVYKWRVAADLLNLFGIDAASLGNHEFDDGVDGLVPFINKVNFPIVSSNLDLQNEPKLAATKLKKSVVLTVAGRKIGVIGYLTPETKELSESGMVEFLDEVECIRKEANRLKAEGVDILIALGHSGYDIDQKIAAEVADIDLVVGGHTNTFLYTGKPPDATEAVQGPYPTVVTQESGKQVPVVQAYAFTKYIGYLELSFNDRGEVTSWMGNPILLDNKIKRDPTILKALETWRNGIDAESQKIIGVTRVFLMGNARYCRMAECNLGNLVADAFINTFTSLYNKQSGFGWTDAPIGLINGGGIRADIDVSNENSSLTMADVMTVLPFDNSLAVVHLMGEHLLEALEFSVARYDPTGLIAPGGFLQFSGLRVQYDMCKPVNQRVVYTVVRCGDCLVPTYGPIDPEKTYGIVMPMYLATGGDGYKLKNYAINRTVLDVTDTGILATYITKMTPVYPEIEGRITFAKTYCGNGTST